MILKINKQKALTRLHLEMAHKQPCLIQSLWAAEQLQTGQNIMRRTMRIRHI